MGRCADVATTRVLARKTKVQGHYSIHMIASELEGPSVFDAVKSDCTRAGLYIMHEVNSRDRTLSSPGIGAPVDQLGPSTWPN